MQPLLDRDPILLHVPTYLACRGKVRTLRERSFSETLDVVRSMRGLPIVSRIEEAIRDLDRAEWRARGVDPFHSTTIRTWIGALDRCIVWIRRGTGRSILDHFSDVTAFEQDLANEYPELAVSHVAPDHLMVHNRLRVVPVEVLARSPRLEEPIQRALPGFPHADGYARYDHAAFERTARHLERALTLLRDISSTAYAGLLENVHVIGLTRFASRETSTSTRADFPGLVFVALSEQQIRDDDIEFTASLLYHEHCHLKLVLYLEANAIQLPSDAIYVSPFKNENRDLSKILHQVYPISMECAVRQHLLDRYAPELRKGAIQQLAFTAFRMELILDHLPLFPPLHCTPVIDELHRVSSMVLEVTDAIIREEPSETREAFARERQDVLARHIWDIGQFLCRGVAVRDRGLTSARLTDEQADFVYRGIPHRAVIDGARRSPSRYL